MIEHLIAIYGTPAMILGMGIFVGRVNTQITDLRRELQEFKVQCNLTKRKRC
jgi:hypothetical protein